MEVDKLCWTGSHIVYFDGILQVLGYVRDLKILEQNNSGKYLKCLFWLMVSGRLIHGSLTTRRVYLDKDIMVAGQSLHPHGNWEGEWMRRRRSPRTGAGLSNLLSAENPDLTHEPLEDISHSITAQAKHFSRLYLLNTYSALMRLMVT